MYVLLYLMMRVVPSSFHSLLTSVESKCCTTSGLPTAKD